MSRVRGAAMFAGGLVAGAAVVALALRGPEPATVDAATGSAQISNSRRTAITEAARRVSPAVVTVSVITTRTVRVDPFGGFPRDEFFDRFFPPNEYTERIPGLGSGVIVSADGLVLTNSHVIRDANDIRVSLADGRALTASVVGDSPIYDLAVLKVNGERLPVAPLGDSDSLVVGEWAIAIGNPFGYLMSNSQPTVTAGVISATRRDIKSEATESGVYKNMIQTDAAINPGNSGGPLVNGDGQVIGINTFIFTQTGGSVGLGFALPINLARRILAEIKQYGRVRIAWPGMQVQPVTEPLARRLGYRTLGGLVVTRVEAGGPAEAAGVRVGDRIRKVNGRVTDTVDDAQSSIYGAGVGDRLVFDIERGEEKMRRTVTLAEAPRAQR